MRLRQAGRAQAEDPLRGRRRPFLSSGQHGAERNGHDATTGHPEPLKGDLSGLWSVRIDEEDGMVF
ncbi:MAG: type II toxin-antitoxin system YoeB family toxin [Synergistaceae bacterium]|nr:type II toxin-antitoxin system YoeB family toxin [Synergistaceae bacterium]